MAAISTLRPSRSLGLFRRSPRCLRFRPANTMPVQYDMATTVLNDAEPFSRESIEEVEDILYLHFRIEKSAKAESFASRKPPRQNR